MKVIDLLNKIANGEEVPKFWWNGCIHQVEKDYTGDISIFDTYCKKYKKVELEDLNEEINFLEEDKKIEKLEFEEDGDFIQAPSNVLLMSKINEIIDKLNEGE
jgi:hypothetical protein